MDCFEGEGRTLDEALQGICERHGVAKEDLDYEVVDQRRKLLGLIGRDTIHVRAWRKSLGGGEVSAVLEKIFELAGLQCAVVDAKETQEALLLEISGQDLKLIIGKNGEVLDALQHIVNKVVNRALRQPRKVVLDGDRYRERRVAGLKRLAIRSAEQVKRSGQSVVLDPMNAHDRRIIHLELKDDQDVTTRSLGSGPFKKVVIASRRSEREQAKARRGI
jgi:spoIIIJ-associated protein